LIEYKTFVDLGPDGEAPPGYKKIRCHIIYDVKHDGRHKARIIAGGHLTDPNTESVYSGVVSLRGIRLIVFLADLNGLELWGADVGNAYLEAKTKEKVYIVAGPEFGPME
jgi:Reverse transcriptase (RNA-dependent DNA polymerase)